MCPPVACLMAAQAADNLQYTWEAVAAVADKHGLVTSNLPLPFAHQSGTGCHCHLSLWRVGPTLGNHALATIGSTMAYCPHTWAACLRSLSPVGAVQWVSRNTCIKQVLHPVDIFVAGGAALSIALIQAELCCTLKSAPFAGPLAKP